MAISNHTIISRMLSELHMVQGKSPSKAELLKRVGNVKLMCELLLENETQDSASIDPDMEQKTVSDEEMIQMLQEAPEMTDEEYNVMIKGKNISDKEEHKIGKETATKDVHSNHGGANGESIFDF